MYSYDEDDMVLDSKLPEHLAHFGIDMMTMEKACSVVFFFFTFLCYFLLLKTIVSYFQINSYFLNIDGANNDRVGDCC